MAKLWTHLLFSVPIISIQSLQDLGTWGLLYTEHVPHCCLWVSQTVYRYWYVLKLKTFCEVKRADFSLKGCMCLCTYCMQSVGVMALVCSPLNFRGLPWVFYSWSKDWKQNYNGCRSGLEGMAGNDAGKGKMRNCLMDPAQGTWIIYNRDAGVTKAFRNIPGVLFKCSNSLLLGKWYQDI